MGNVLRKITCDPVDGGSVKQETPSGEYDVHKVQRLIIDRRLAPFYEGRSESISVPSSPISITSTSNSDCQSDASISESDLATSTISQHHYHQQQQHQNHNRKKKKKKRKFWTSKRQSRRKKKLDTLELEAFLRDCTAECPICFLHYPRNINRTDCCHQNLCTACFVGMRRPPSGRTLSCPFCNRRDFGITYAPPSALLNDSSGETRGPLVKCESIRVHRPPPPSTANYRAAISRHYNNWYYPGANTPAYHGGTTALPGEGWGGTTVIVGYNRNGVPMYAPARSYRPQRTVWYHPYQPPSLGYSYPPRRPGGRDTDYSSLAFFEAMR